MYEDIELYFINASRLIFCEVITKYWSYDEFTYAVCSKNFKGKLSVETPLYIYVTYACAVPTSVDITERATQTWRNAPPSRASFHINDMELWLIILTSEDIQHIYPAKPPTLINSTTLSLKIKAFT
jgi:hypothetical protein